MKIPSTHNFNEEIYQYIGNINSPIISAMTGITFPDPEYDLNLHYFNAYSIEYVYSGNGVIQQDNKIQKIEAGDLFMIHPGSVHYFANPKNPWKKIWLHVNGGFDFIQSLLNIFKINDEFLYIQNFKKPAELENIIEIIKQNDDDVAEQLIKHIFFLFMEINSAQKNRPQNNSIAAQAKTYIDRFINVKLSTNDIAKFLSISPDYLTRVFKKNYGVTPIDYIMHERIEQAKMFLKLTDLPIYKIAEHFAFYDNKHFSNTFSKLTGISPSEYRKKYKIQYSD